jgi:hypothetical protein
MHILNGIILILMLLMIAIFSINRLIGHKRSTIEICLKSPNEARQGPVPNKHEHGRARREEGLSSAISDPVNQGQGCRRRRRTTIKDDQAKKSEMWLIAEE